MPTYRNGQTGEIIEVLQYAPVGAPGYAYAGGVDLETSPTKTISNTSENAVADYTTSHALTAPTDSRIVVLRGAMRLTATIDSWGGGGVQLNYRVKRGGASVSTGVLAVAAATGQKIISWDITSLITGTQSNTIFFWVDAGTCVLSEVTLWTALGSTSATNYPCMSVSHVGKLQFLSLAAWTKGSGTTRLGFNLVNTHSDDIGTLAFTSTAAAIQSLDYDTHPQFGRPLSVTAPIYIVLNTPSVATDMPFIMGFSVALTTGG